MKALASIALAFVGVLVFLTTATVVRSRVRELKGHLEHCKEMCNPGQRDAVAETGQSSCCGTAG